ncbi:hypothetical protein [Longimycelium tulufanense]|uniref:hypothetical protein n=1 Tax=Longimycelium tulufanense TaxID=907463 RepID=UPI001665A753|nr:hypothetical protein [Longimycelium tulufanense]
MSIQRQSKDSSSKLSQFLDAYLPHCTSVTDAWRQSLNAPSWAGPELEGGWDNLGCALELRIGLDLARQPAPWSLLSYLPADQCVALLTAVGFEHARVGPLPDSGTADPALQHWSRAWNPHNATDEAQRNALALCLDLVEMRDLAHKWGETCAVEERRSWFLAIIEQGRLGGDVQLLDALTHTWDGYLRHGRDALGALGERVVVAPEFGHGFGVGDLVVGCTVVDVKVTRDPTSHLDQWLRQLLGYVLLDRGDALHLDGVAVYTGVQAQLLTCPLTELLRAASPGPTPQLSALREEFYATVQDDLDSFVAWTQRRRYSR